jgi:hypothetical protein
MIVCPHCDTPVIALPVDDVPNRYRLCRCRCGADLLLEHLPPVRRVRGIPRGPVELFTE